MKTAISIPDDLFKRAEKAARKLGIARSELYSRAIRTFLESWHAEDVTRTLDSVYSSEPAAVDEALRYMQAISIPSEDW